MTSSQTKARKRNLKKYKGVNPRKSKRERLKRICPVCGSPISLVPCSEMNFRSMRKETEGLLYWRCSRYPVCDTYIKADPRTKEPSGLLAGPSLRHKRICIHQWEQMFLDENTMDKPQFRQMCGSMIGLHTQGVVHTRFMTEMECDTILEYLTNLYKNQQSVHDMVESRKNTSMWKLVHGMKYVSENSAFDYVV